MKGLMVSLIIVIFAGMTSNTVVASQQGGQEAAGLLPRLHPIPAFERPGPDDSTDDVAWPAPTSLLSRNSTVTSRSNQSGSQPFADPTPDSATDKDGPFEVKVNDNAIELLRQGRKVFSQVNVKDEATNVALHPKVVNQIVLYHGANTGKQLQGILMEPQPLEPGSTTLRFEIQEQQLDRIEKEAFIFPVPQQLRGQFDRVEFVAVGNSSAQNSSLGFPAEFGKNPRSESTTEFDRFASSQSGGFEDPRSTPALDRWQNPNIPRPGPNIEPGESNFTGPYISPSELESRRNQVAPINFVQRQSIPQQPDGNGFPLNTNGGFRTARQAPEAQPKQNPFGRTWEQRESNQNNFPPQNSYPQQDTIRRNNQSLAEQQLSNLQQQLANAKAEKEQLEQRAAGWEKAANNMREERNNLNKQLQVANSRPVTQQQPVNTRPTTYNQITTPSYWGNTLSAAANLVTPYGSPPKIPQRRETAYNGMTQNELAMQQTIETLKEHNGTLSQLKEAAEEQLNQERRHRDGPAHSDVQPTSYNPEYLREANANNGRPDYIPPKTGRQKMRIDNQAGNLVNDNKGKQKSSSRFDLFWLLLLLLISVGLNLFLWLHSRSLHLQYNDLAVELREMVGASTV